MIISIFPAQTGLFLKAASPCDIDLAADDRLDPLAAGGLIKIDGPKEHAMIGYRQGRELQLMRFIHEPVHAASAIEQRILGVNMKMNKVSVRHTFGDYE